MKELYVRCDCNHIEHLLVLSYDSEDPDYIYTEMHLAKWPFWHRVKYAIKYIFGKQSKYGAFEEILINKETSLKIKKFIEEFNNDYTRTTSTSN